MPIWIEWASERFGWNSRRDHDTMLVVGFVPILKDYGIFDGLIVFRNGFRSAKQSTKYSISVLQVKIKNQPAVSTFPYSNFCQSNRLSNNNNRQISIDIAQVLWVLLCIFCRTKSACEADDPRGTSESEIYKQSQRTSRRVSYLVTSEKRSLHWLPNLLLLEHVKNLSI